MKLHNTLTRKKEEFKPLEKDKVKLYTCGPTVYHYAHIGNLRNVIFNDTLRRTLEAANYKVHHVMNVTDVGHLASDADEGEDKLEKGAAREGKTVWQVADFYLRAFQEHIGLLGALPPHDLIRATEAISAQIKMIERLIEKGFAYRAQQAIYFDVSRLDDYGKLSGQKLDDKEVGVRDEIVTDSEKRHPQDFAIWFFTVGHFADHQMRWESPWGEGFPGWHLECSAIIHQSLGEPIDIHTGGVDHIGTHHTNEIAQSEAAFDKPLANYWLHNEFLHQNGGKMAKSGGGTITLNDIKAKGFDPLALRLLYLQAHYRSEQNFTWEILGAAQNLLKNIYAWADLKHQATAPSYNEDLYQEVVSAMEDDLNTPEALSILSQLMESPPTGNLLQKLDGYFGLQLANRPGITKEQELLILKREQARNNKNFQSADVLREQLRKDGLEIDDTSEGPRWSRV